MPGELKYTRTRLLSALAAGAAFSGATAAGPDFFLRLPSIPGVANEIRFVRFYGAQNVGNINVLTHSLNLGNASSIQELFDDTGIWAVGGFDAPTSGGSMDRYFADPYVVAGIQNWRGFNGGGGSAANMFVEVAYTQKTISMTKWAELARRTSWEGD